jgi:hypothetical protein
VAGSTGDNGLVSLATVNGPKSISLDGNGDLCTAEGSNRVRKINTIITTIIGTSAGSFSGDGSLGKNAAISA